MGTFDKKRFAELLEKARGENRSINQYALNCGVSAAHISRLIRGILTTPPNPDTIQLLANKAYNNVTYDELLEAAGHVTFNIEKDIINFSSMNKIPVLGIIRAGEPMFAEQNIIEYIELPSEYLNNGEYFGLKVVGDSMNLSRILEGDIVIVRRQESIENGDIAVVLVDGENATIKRFYQTETTITLLPNSSNPTYQPRIIDAKKVSVKVLGKVVQVIVKF